MARKKNLDQGEELTMDLSPMIDCVFLLLIFFIVVSVQSEVETDNRVTPTIASESAIQTDSIARIVINAFEDPQKGIMYSREDKEEVKESDLAPYIEKEVKYIKRTRPTVPIILHLRCDRRLAWSEIQKVKKAAALKGVINVNFASYQE